MNFFLFNYIEGNGWLCWTVKRRRQRTVCERRGMVMACFRGNLEPINSGNFWDQKRQSDSFHLVVWHTFVSASSLWSDQSVRIHFFLLSCAQLSPRKRNLWTNQWVRWVGSWKLHAPFALKSLIRFAVVSHAAVGVGHENILALLMQRSLTEYGKRFLTCNATEPIQNWTHYLRVLVWHVWIWQREKLVGEEEEPSRRSEKPAAVLREFPTAIRREGNCCYGWRSGERLIKGNWTK